MLRLFQRHAVDIFNLTTGKLVPCQKVSISEGVKNTSCFSFLSAQMLVYKAECIFDYLWLIHDLVLCRQAWKTFMYSGEVGSAENLNGDYFFIVFRP